MKNGSLVRNAGSNPRYLLAEQPLKLAWQYSKPGGFRRCPPAHQAVDFASMQEQHTPYTRYFLSHILQFQFYKSLCEASGHTGPLYSCNFANNPEAGKRYWAMLERGAGQPWQATLKELTGGEQMDGSAVLEYFAPLQTWLVEKKKGKTCGWWPSPPHRRRPCMSNRFPTLRRADVLPVHGTNAGRRR